MLNVNEEELQCKICYEFLNETVLCVKCSNAFCQECAINYKKKAKKYGRVDKCPICGSKNFTFQRCEEIDKLIKKRKQKPLQCAHCKRIIFDKNEYEEHIEDCKYQCKFCSSVFERGDDLLRHIKKNTDELLKALDLMNASHKTEKNNKTKKYKKSRDYPKKESIKYSKTDDVEDEKFDENYQIKKKVYKKKQPTAKKNSSSNISTHNKNTSNYTEPNNIIEKNYTKMEKKIIDQFNELNLENSNNKEKTAKKSKTTLKNKRYNTARSLKDQMKDKSANKIKEDDLTLNKDDNDENNAEEESLHQRFIGKISNPLINYSISEKKKNYQIDQVVEEETKISKYVDYLNNPRPVSQKPVTIPVDAKLNTTYDLYFCGRPNHIDCICCTEHKCLPGNCMCISCMKLNKKYHKLKSHYLINKTGRACKYSHGSFHCYCNYSHIVHDVGSNIFKPVYRCQGENVCRSCEEITLLMETYLPSSICQKLRDRETRQGQF